MEEQKSQPTNKELYNLRRQEKEKIREVEIKKRQIQKIIKWSAMVLVILIPIGLLGWYIATRPPVPEGEIISRSGLHWHPTLAIYVKGEKQEISANIGIGAVHAPMHTHDTSGVIHLEFQGVVKKEDITLGQFFTHWGKDFMVFGSSVRMTVNGKENAELENYILQDKDQRLYQRLQIPLPQL